MGTASNFQLGEIMRDDDLVIPDIISRNLFIGSRVHERCAGSSVPDRFRQNRMGIYCNQTIPSCPSIADMGGMTMEEMK